jgi:hypothetical protein
MRYLVTARGRHDHDKLKDKAKDVIRTTQANKFVRSFMAHRPKPIIHNPAGSGSLAHPVDRQDQEISAVLFASTRKL